MEVSAVQGASAKPLPSFCHDRGHSTSGLTIRPSSWQMPEPERCCSSRVKGASRQSPAKPSPSLSSVALRKRGPAIDLDEIAAQVESLREGFEILPLTPAVVLEALRGVRQHQLRYYDSQIWAAAP